MTCLSEQSINDSNLLKRYSLRVLDFVNLGKLPSSISQLKHPRYLNLTRGYFITLPESSCRLWNLQILKLEFCQYVQRLPNKLTCLKALRHLYLRGCLALSSLPPHIGQLTLMRTLNKYFVDKISGFLLEELGHLNLKGELHIKNLERISSVRQAQKANMVGKHLSDLRLSWNRNGESEQEGNVEQILEALEPHTQHLKALRVGGYRGVHFPRWMGSATLENLNVLELVGCINCVQLPPLWKLPSLERLTISKMNHVRYVDDESCIGGVARGFRALELLILDELPSPESLSKEEGEVIIPRLSEVQSVLWPYLAFHLLESLRFTCDEELTSFPDGVFRNLTSLKILDIYKFDKLSVPPSELINLNALEELYIAECNSLELIEEQVWQGLHSLKRLDIGWCQKLNLSTGLQYLTSLKELNLSSCPMVNGFLDLEPLQYLTALQSLRLSDLPNLESLPDCFGNLKDLRLLLISECHKLISLPISIKDLGSLKDIYIYLCPELIKRCEKEIGEDWHKIAHVPHIYMINTCGCCRNKFD